MADLMASPMTDLMTRPLTVSMSDDMTVSMIDQDCDVRALSHSCDAFLQYRPPPSIKEEKWYNDLDFSLFQICWFRRSCFKSSPPNQSPFYWGAHRYPPSYLLDNSWAPAKLDNLEVRNLPKKNLTKCAGILYSKARSNKTQASWCVQDCC